MDNKQDSISFPVLIHSFFKSRSFENLIAIKMLDGYSLIQLPRMTV